MRFSLFLGALLLAPTTCFAQPTVTQPAGVKLATHQQLQPHASASSIDVPVAIDAVALETAAIDAETITRIRKIVLNQSDNGRALANLVQLTRQLPAPTAAQIYFGLSTDYLELGKYNQAGDLLKQLLNQYPDQPPASAALTRMVRLYSSSEVSNTQQKGSNAADTKSYCVYAQYLADEAQQKNAAYAKLPELSFQRAVAARLSGEPKTALGRLSSLKRQRSAGIWRMRALAEKWLQSNREDDSPVPTTLCRRTEDKPHLDGVLNDSLWQTDLPVQFAYDQKFLYLAIRCPKVAGQDYTPDARPRSYDADLAGHDQLRLRLDADRDYATCFELAVDHRGWTADKCWLDTSWNLKWFVASGGDENTWTVEAAIPWKQLCAVPPRSGESWVVGWERVLGGSGVKTAGAVVENEGEDFPAAEAASPSLGGGELHLLLFQ